MKCAVHSDVDATGYCRNCGKAMCSVCVRPVREVLYCEDCLAIILGHSSAVPPQIPAATAPPPAPPASVPAPSPRSSGSSPILAFFLGFLPGLGAFYNEQYGKGMIHLSIFLLLFITGVNGVDSAGATAALWICIAALWVYMPIDALRTAQAKQEGKTLSDPLDSFSKQRPVGPMILIAVGLLLLLSNFEWFQWYRVIRFWPVLLIALGILMFRSRMGRNP